MTAEAIENLRQSKAPEDWTLEERLAVRFDAGDISRRREADREEMKKNKGALPGISEGGEAAATGQSNSLVGRRNPELFLPTEIFDSLVQNCFIPEPQIRDSCRLYFQEGLVAAGFDPESFWSVLATIARATIAAHKEYYDINQKLAKATPAERKRLNKRLGEIAPSLCTQRAAELAEARKRFGRKELDRFLYRAVTQTMFQLMSPDPEWQDQLREMEGGCHAAAQ